MQRTPETSRRPAWGKIALAVLVMVGVAAAWRFTPLADYFNAHRIAGWARAARATRWAPVVLILAYTPAAFLLFPRPLLTLASVIAFGAYLGFAYAVVGILAAALVTYAVGRFVSYDKVKRIAGDTMDDAKQIFRGHAIVGVLAANMVPVPPFGVQGVIAGSMKLNVWQYLLGTLLSLLPGAVMLAIFGHQLSSVLEGKGGVSYWLLAMPLLGMAIFVFLGRRWASRRK